LWEPLQPPIKTVQESVGKTASLSEAGRSARKRAFEEINLQCLEALDLSFHALALGGDPPPYDSRCPFQGLAPFGREHHEFFFGREALIERLQQGLQHHPFLAVVGSSGCGKSSLVLAGLVPALQHDEPKLQLVALTPGSEPLDQLQGSLAHLDASRPCVLVVDQFEELFTLCSSEQKRREFLKELLALINQHPVVITMRTDFLAECAPYQTFKTLLQEHLELVAPMDPRELRRAMEQQVAAVGLRFDADLGSRILEDVEREPAAMPLLQHALLELWKRRHGRWLRAEEYRAIGGIQQAIAKTADAVYQGLDPAEQQRVREIFVRLTKPDVDALAGEERRDTRQRVELEELVPVGSELEATKALVKRLADARLIVTSLNGMTGHEEVEMAHEALIRHWPRLRTWLNEEHESLRLHARLREAAREWERGGKPKDQLYRGSQLKEARAWAKRNTPSRNEEAFLRASVAQRMRSLARMTVLVLLLLSTTGVAGYFLTRPDPTYVNTLQDNDKLGSLRYAVDNAPSRSTIKFDTSLRGPILLTSGDLNIAKDLTIRGPGAGILSISSGKSGHVVRVAPTVTVTISGLTFKDSETIQSFIDNEGRLTLSNSTVSGNTVSGQSSNGGGISNSGSLMLSNSTVSGNSTTGSGGGIDNEGTLTLSNSTVSGNTVPDDHGGGIFNNGGDSTLTVSIAQSIVANNPGGDCASGGLPITDMGYNLDSDGTCGFTPAKHDLPHTNPQLDPAGLANNGGPTRTIALLPGSPAIDIVPRQACSIIFTDVSGHTVTITTDQRGFPRPDTKESVCDIGAYEFQDPAPAALAPSLPGQHWSRASAGKRRPGELLVVHRLREGPIDLMGAVRSVEAAKPFLQQAAAEKGDAAIVIIASVSAVMAYPQWDPSPYGAVKAALINFAKGVERHEASKGIRANVVSPGTVYFTGGFWKTMEQNMPDLFKDLMRRNPMGRMATPQEIAKAVVFLASPASSFTTGINLVVDGALTARVNF
jgi:energy-coupling factor transporter ATP-binding protein EcfA2